MSEVLVLVDCDKSADGKVTKPTLELLTIARRLGEPSAVVIGDADSETLKNAETVMPAGTSPTRVVTTLMPLGHLASAALNCPAESDTGELTF